MLAFLVPDIASLERIIRFLDSSPPQMLPLSAIRIVSTIARWLHDSNVFKCHRTSQYNKFPNLCRIVGECKASIRLLVNATEWRHACDARVFSSVLFSSLLCPWLRFASLLPLARHCLVPSRRCSSLVFTLSLLCVSLLSTLLSCCSLLCLLLVFLLFSRVRSGWGGETGGAGG